MMAVFPLSEHVWQRYGLKIVSIKNRTAAWIIYCKFWRASDWQDNASQVADCIGAGCSQIWLGIHAGHRVKNAHYFLVSRFAEGPCGRLAVSLRNPQRTHASHARRRAQRAAQKTVREVIQ
jgi:hypothetical protein